MDSFWLRALWVPNQGSIWTFSSRGAFDAHSLELLQIVTQLAESIDVGERSVTGPWLQWILQGVHLQPILKGKVVSAQKYFDSMLHTADDPFKKRGPEKQRAQKRNEIRESLVRSFAALNVTPFPPFTADEELLRQLPHITRDHPGLNSDFVKALDLFKISMLHAVKPLQLQRDHKLITAHGPTLVEFMRKALDYINNEQPVPIFNLVDEVINKQIEKAKEETKRGWRACMEHHLEIQQGLQLSQRQLALTRMAEAGQVSFPYWGAFLRKDVSRLLEASRFPHEERNLSAWHQGCYRKALATALEPLNEESHNVQERLVSKVEKELGIGPHQNASDRAIAHIERENKELANLYNVKLFELLGEAHLSHLRVSFLNVTSEDFQDMLRVFERAYAALSAGPGSMELYFEQKKKFLTHSEAFVSIGKMMREMEEKHDAALKEVRQLIENYKSDLAKLQNEYDVINAERGRLQQEMDLQARQHNDTLSNLLIQHENMKKRSEQLNETQWQLREQMSTRQQEHEAQIQRIQDEYATRQDQQKALAQNLQHQIQQKEAQFQNLTQQVEAAAANNALLREEIRRLEEQECGTRLVTACTDVNYGGTCRGLRVSWWSHCSLVNEGIPDNSMQSARIPPGCHLTVWDGQGYRGDERTYTSDVPLIDLRGGVSSARVF